MLRLLAPLAVLAAPLRFDTAGFSGEEIHCRFGCSVAGLGDVDGDGVPDFLVADPEGPDPGRVWLISGKTSRTIYTCTGHADGDEFGWDLRAVGDVDGDGIVDWIAGADGMWRFKEGGESYASVHSGRDGRRLFLIRSDDPDQELGRCFAGAGDVDGDRRQEFVIGAKRASSDGVAYVYSGADGKRIRSLGKTVEAGTRAVDMAALGDCNGDHVPDVLIALRGNADGKFEAKSAVLFSGSTGEPIWTFQTETNHEIQRVRAGGDVNGDGIPDALVSCCWFVLILSGKDGSVIRRLEPAAQQYPHTFPFESLDSEHFGSAVAVLESHGLDWRVAIGAEETAAATGAVYLIDLKTEARPLFFPSDDDGPFYQLGSNLDRAGDVDGDGMDDVLCGTFAFFGEDEGLALVLSGKDGKELRRFVRRGDEVIALGIGEMAPRPGDSPSKPASPPEDSAKPLHPTFGCLVSEVGDADGDGTPDLLVADSGFSHSHVWLVSLAKRRALYSVPELSWGMETQRILPLGDVDGDGHPDWLQACCCTARIFSGIDGRLIREITEQLPGQVDDSSFSAIGDLDHDGHADVLIGTNRVSEGGRESGLASVRSGLDGHVLITVGDHEPRGWLEIAVGGTGDVDLDGTPDIGVVCGEYPEPKLSLVVFSGRTGAVLRRVRDLPTDGRIRFRPCGDLDGDGRLDCLIGTRGLVEVLSDYSDVTSLVLTARGLEYDAENADTEFARGLAGLSGRRSSHLDPSIAVSAPASPASGGSIHFCSAIDGAERAQFTEFGYESARKSGDYVIPDSVKWPTYPYRLGCSLADLGDVNGDGYDDVICGTENWYAHGEDGQAFVLDGSSGKLLYELRQSGDNVLVLAVGRDH